MRTPTSPWASHQNQRLAKPGEEVIYEFRCEQCGKIKAVEARAFEPPKPEICMICHYQTIRIYAAQIDTSGCKDHDFIPPDKRVYDSVQSLTGERKGKLFTDHVTNRRKELREGNHGDFRQTHSVPADLYHGKIKETGDKEYWSDPANMRRHESCRVDR